MLFPILQQMPYNAMIVKTALVTLHILGLPKNAVLGLMPVAAIVISSQMSVSNV